MQIKKVLGNFAASQFGTKLQLKYCYVTSIKNYKLCACKASLPQSTVNNIQKITDNIESQSPFLSTVFSKHCKAIFLLKTPRYGFQLNNGIFYINTSLIEDNKTEFTTTLLLQLLYQKRLYQKLGIQNTFYISSIEQTALLNNRFMGNAWKKYQAHER